jgi:pimeloyl-ACP methyl ester carboxylesterase
MTAARRAGVALAVLAVVAAGACGDGGGQRGATGGATTSTTAPPTTTTSTTTATTEPAGPCGLAGARDITFPAGRGGATLHGVLTGSGPTAIVLAHEFRSDACGWAFFVPELATRGRQVLAFDFDGDGSSAPIGDGRLDLDVLAAVSEARRRGATSVVVIGASKGATAAVTAAAASRSGIDGVVSLSAVASYLSADAEAAAARVAVPVLFAAARGDGSLAEVAQAMARSCGCAYPQVLLFDGTSHGTRLLAEGPDGESVRAAISRLITRAT